MSATKELTIPEMQKAITEYKAELNTLKTTFETYKADVEKEKEEIKKKVEEDSPKHEGKNAKFHKAMKAAMDEKDEDKKAEKMKEAMSHYKADAEEDEEEKKEAEAEKEEKEAMKAELAKSRLQVLTASYKGRVEDKKLAEFTAQWNKMSFKQLDAEIDKIKPFAAKTITQNESIPLSPVGSTLQFSGSVSTKDEFSAKVDEMKASDLFGGKY